MNMAVELGRLKLKNPITVASGTFGYGEEYSSIVDLNRIGAVIVKGLTLKPRHGNPPPRIAETPSGMLNAIGLQNVGVDCFVKEKVPFLSCFDTAIIANINGSTIDEYRELAKILNKVDEVSALEINLSCPNVREGGIHFGTMPEKVFELTDAVRVVYDKAVLVKLSPNITDIIPLARAAVEAGADGVSVINTLLGMAVDIRKRKPVLKNITGGLSGPAIKPVALRMVHEIYQHVPVPILGMGGISSVEDVLEFLIVGASAVSIGTANFINPCTSIQILDKLISYMNENNIVDICDLTGSLKI
ncbi:MAG: dihydroorotate dehydrogenase [Chlamydiota bacterium]|nr:dihydroorotate dehydrogenase [Chlamydiota bacterium]